MANDSTTSGPLAPDPTGPIPLEGTLLDEFIQGWLVGVTGLDPTLVRPRWQTEPPNIPNAGVCWMAFGVSKHGPDTYAIIEHDGSFDDGSGTLGCDYYHRHETLNILSSFYDLGTGGLASYFASVLIAGVQIGQNRDVLTLQGYNVTDTGEAISVPSLLKERWQQRIDVEVVLRRVSRWRYKIRNVSGLEATVAVDNLPPSPVNN